MNEKKKILFSRTCYTIIKKSLEVVRSLFRWKHIDQLFLIPLTMWTMIEHGFLVVQFTRVRK